MSNVRRRKMRHSEIMFNLALAFVGFIALVSPILVSAFLSVFKGGGVRGRWLFLFAGPVLAYSILWVFTLFVIVPATFVVVLLAPVTKELFNQMPYWFGLAALATKYQALLACAVFGLLASWLALYVWPRWPALLWALVQPPESARKP
jgi:hypothetical protein